MYVLFCEMCQPIYMLPSLHPSTRTICTTHTGYTSQVYKPNAALFKENAEYFKTVKEQPTPVEGIVKGNKHTYHFSVHDSNNVTFLL